MSFRLTFIPLLAATMLLGCRNVQTRTYDVSVENKSSRPITVWLTKDGPLWEEGWKSPEDIAIESPRARDPIAGVVVPAGRSASTGPVKGRFEPETQAILRIYVGELTFNQILAVGRGDASRIDMVLQEGRNDFIVTDDTGVIRAERVP